MPAGRRIGRALLFAGPILLALGVLAFLATDSGSYPKSVRAFYGLVWWLSPDYPEFRPMFDTSQRIEQTVIIYPIIGALRKLGHVALYGSLALLVARAVQAGRPALRWQTPLAMMLATTLITGAESFVRLRFATERHVRWEQLWLNLIGAGVGILLTLLFFGIKALERRFSE
jgi:VanZ family protein